MPTNYLHLFRIQWTFIFTLYGCDMSILGNLLYLCRFSLFSRVCLIAPFVFSIGYSCYAQDSLSDPIVFTRQISYLVEACKFTEASDLLKAAVNSGDSALVPTLQQIELHYMPRIKISPAAEELLRKADASYAKGDYKAFRVLSKQCTELYPQSEFAHLILSKSYFGDAQDSLAISEAKKAVSIAPDNIQALQHLGRCYMYAHRKNEAVKTFKAIQAIEPRNVSARDFFSMLNDVRGRIGDIPMIDRQLAKKELEKQVKSQ